MGNARLAKGAENHTKKEAMTTQQIQQFADLLPKHKVTLSITHNEHREYHEPLTSYIDERDSSWENEESRQRAIATDEIWEMQWYPDTSVGFYCAAAPTLPELISFAKKIEETSPRSGWPSFVSEF